MAGTRALGRVVAYGYPGHQNATRSIPIQRGFHSSSESSALPTSDPGLKKAHNKMELFIFSSADILRWSQLQRCIFLRGDFKCTNTLLASLRRWLQLQRCFVSMGDFNCKFVFLCCWSYLCGWFQQILFWSQLLVLQAPRLFSWLFTDFFNKFNKKVCETEHALLFSFFFTKWRSYGRAHKSVCQAFPSPLYPTDSNPWHASQHSVGCHAVTTVLSPSPWITACRIDFYCDQHDHCPRLLSSLYRFKNYDD